MKDHYYIKFSRHGIEEFYKTDKFRLGPGEHAVRMEIEVPDEIFIKPPIPVTRITLNPSQIIRDVGADTTNTPETPE